MRNKKPDGQGDGYVKTEETNQQKLPGFITNSAGTIYICPTEGCAKVFSNYQNYAAHIELDIHDKKNLKKLY